MKKPIRFSAILACFMLSMPSAWGQSLPENDALSTSSYLVGSGEEYLRDKGDCSDPTRFANLKRFYTNANTNLDVEIAKDPRRLEASQLKVVALYRLAECYDARNNKTLALQFSEEAAETVSKLLEIYPDDVLSQRELVLAESIVGIRALEIFQKQKASAAFKRAVLQGEDLVRNQPFNYSDHKDLVLNLMRLSRSSDDAIHNIEVAKRAVCVAQKTMLGGQVTEEDKGLMFGGVIVNLAEVSAEANQFQDGATLTCPQ